MHARPIPLLCARFVFDDHIRCMAAKQRLTKGRLRARQRKMQMIARLLELPTHIVESMYQPSANMSTSATTLRTSVSSGAIPG
jgi:protein CLEC16A